MHNNKPTISVVVPCYNEQEVLPLYVKTMQEVIEQMQPANIELIFVDDGSSDNTLKLLKEYHEKNKDFRYLSLSRNFGKESALYAGIKAAEGENVVVMDADLQDPPDYIPVMYDILQEGEYDCVSTRRGDRNGEAKIRSFLSASFYKLINKLSDVQIVEGARDFRMMNRKMTDAVLALGECNRFSKGLFGWVGFKTKWLEYHNVERAAGDTKWSIWKLFKYSMDGILSFSTVPLSLASYGGILFCAVAFIMILFLVVKNLFWHDPVAGWPAMMCVIFLIGGIQLLCIGISGQYLARAYAEIKNRPIYLLRESSDEEDTKTANNNKKQGRNLISLDSYSNPAHSVYTKDKKRVSGRF